MSILESIILGIIQGLTEFLPVSSSGHLVLAQYFWGINEPGISFEIIVHLGSLLAVLIYFHKDLLALLLSATKVFSSKKTYSDVNNLKVIAYLIIATITTAGIGIMFKDNFESLYNIPLAVAISLFVTGLITYISDKIPNGDFEDYNIGWAKAIFIGIGQALAIIPGISRSGTTIAFALFSKMKRENAARFSFLLSIPAILGAALLDFLDMENFDLSLLGRYSFGALSAFISGFLVIALLINLIQRKKLKYFSYYCWLASLVSIYFILF
jgi:undecaprenyl-diphosphatase